MRKERFKKEWNKVVRRVSTDLRFHQIIRVQRLIHAKPEPSFHHIVKYWDKYTMQVRELS